MNKVKWMVFFMGVTMVFSDCMSMNNTGKGATINGGSGATLDAVLDGVIDKGKGAVIGAATGTAMGVEASAFIGKKMNKAAAEAEQVGGTRVERITDNNGLQAIKVTFNSGTLFTTGNATLSAAVKSALNKFTNDVLDQNRDMDISTCGYANNQGWGNSTTEQSRQKNLNLSQERVQSVTSYPLNCGVSSNQIKGVQGMGESDPIASNDATAGKEQNRRVEVYIHTSERMIKGVQATSN